MRIGVKWVNVVPDVVFYKLKGPGTKMHCYFVRIEENCKIMN